MMAYLSKIAKEVREAKYRNQLKKKYPFIKKFRGGRIYFENVTFAEYIVSGMILDTDSGEVTQVRGRPRHPHGTVYRDGSRGFCGDQSQLRGLLVDGNIEGAILEAFLIISSYNPVGAVLRPAGSLVCFACGEVIREKYAWDYSPTSWPDRWQAGVYHSGGTQYVVYHEFCRQQTYDLIKQIRSDKNGIP